MNIVFLSNFYNHHQAYLSRKLYELTGGNYAFITTIDIPEERKNLGYRNFGDNFVLYYEDAPEKAQTLIDTAEVVIFGSAPEELLENRKKNSKVILRYSERPLKNGFQFWKYPGRWYKWHKRNPFGKPIYMLCASSYTASDYSKFGLFRNRCYKWGYFPECRRYDAVDDLMKKKDVRRLLWCGRFLDWKHPDDALTVAKRLKSENYSFNLEIIGTGELEKQIKDYVEQNGLSEYVSVLGAISPDEVRDKMEQSGIYLFTSDRKEGWGAVLNEAMNSGCAVVAGDQAGASNYLIKNNTNGIMYPSGNTDELYKAIKFLLDNPSEQIRMGKNAYNTIIGEWNAEVAAERLICLAEAIISGDKYPSLYNNGICSKEKTTAN